MNRLSSAALVLAALAAAGPAYSHPEEGEPLVVVTGVAPVAALLAPLIAGTDIEARMLTSRSTPLVTLSAMLDRIDPSRSDLLESADVVATIGGIWPSDPTFEAARGENAWIVEVDATAPLDGSRPPVARISAPVGVPAWREAQPANRTAESSIFPWLGPSAAIAMAEILAHDLSRLSPDQADIIDSNLEEFRADIRRLKAEYDQRFAELADFTVFALTDQFVYLTNEFGIFVDGYFLEQDVRWTEMDYAGLTEHLEDRGITTVLHQWEPAEPITAAIRAAGAELVVLSSGETMSVQSEASYLELMRSNLDTLYQALAE